MTAQPTKPAPQPPIDAAHAAIRRELAAVKREADRMLPRRENQHVREERALTLAYLAKRNSLYPMLPVEQEFMYVAAKFGWDARRFAKWASTREWQ